MRDLEEQLNPALPLRDEHPDLLTFVMLRLLVGVAKAEGDFSTLLRMI